MRGRKRTEEDRRGQERKQEDILSSPIASSKIL
jgi:hypothetical protein